MNLLRFQSAIPWALLRAQCVSCAMLATSLLATWTTLVNSAHCEDPHALIRLPTEAEPALRPMEIHPVHWAPEKDLSGETGLRDILDRLAELETNYTNLQSEHESLKKNLQRHAKTGHSSATMVVHGRVHADVWTFPDTTAGINGFESGDPSVSPQDRIGLRRLRLGAQGQLPCNMAYKIEMELAGGNMTQFRDAYLGWHKLPLLQTLLIGNQKRPYGLDHLNSSRYNVFLERPFVIEGFNQDARRLGIASYGVSENEAWNWRVGYFNQRLVQDEGNYTSDHWQGQFAARLANTIWYDACSDGRGYAHWALASTWADTAQGAASDNFAGSGKNEAQFGDRPEARSVDRWLDTGVITEADDYGLLGVEGLLNLGPIQVVGEYQSVWVHRTTGGDLRIHGGYAYLSCFLTGEHIPWNRQRGVLGRVQPFENFFLVESCRDGVRGGWGAWQLAIRGSYADFVDDDINGGIGKNVTAGLNWHWTPYARMQWNYLYGEITDNDFSAAPGAPNFGHYSILGMRLMVDF